MDMKDEAASLCSEELTINKCDNKARFKGN